jgi:2-haloacid dehalogenase
MTRRPKVVAFDMIGTVFSLEALRPKLDRMGLPALSLQFLYTAGLRDAFALAATNSYAPFLSTLKGALNELLAMHGVSVGEAERQDLLETLKHLAPYQDAGRAFQTLADAGLRIVALSNGSAANTKGLLQAAQLDGFVDSVLSVEAVKLSKPSTPVYLYAATAAEVAPDRMALVASHAWDVHGAKSAGLIGAYVSRGIPFPGCLRQPDLEGRELADVARAIAEL